MLSFASLKGREVHGNQMLKYAYYSFTWIPRSANQVWISWPTCSLDNLLDKHGASSLNVITVPLWTYVLQGGVPSSLFFSMLKVNSTFLVNSNSINELHVYNDKRQLILAWNQTNSNHQKTKSLILCYKQHQVIIVKTVTYYSSIIRIAKMTCYVPARVT